MEPNKDLTTEQSLAIITSMIKNAKGNMRESSFYFLFWGWIVTIASLAEFYLNVYTDFAQPYIVWLIGIPGWIITMIYGARHSKNESVSTYSDGLIKWIWIGFTISILIIIFGGKYFNYQITALILLLSGFATFINGLIIRYKPIIIGGASFWIFSPIALYVGVHYAPLVMAIAVLFGYLIPGYLLKKSK
ncbi:MAG TPA: hypothetical protein PKL31_16475 [Fulvivirga sp.]|nr:hypothetical protein [Fulvivirga sp.]